MRPRAIHQFHSGSAYGDAVTNAMFFIQELLRELGCRSEIYVEHVAPEFRRRLHSIKDYRTAADQVLLVHHSMGHNQEQWVHSLSDLRILIYHNITPARFFPHDDASRFFSEMGREQLVRLKDVVRGSIGDSKSNTRELTDLGFTDAVTLPLLLDPERIATAAWNKEVVQALAETFNVLFVGRLVENKCQHDLIEVFRILTGMTSREVRLVLVGDASGNHYRAHLEESIRRHGIGDRVLMPGKVAAEDLCAYYRAADAFLCLSEHEGFCVPLIEAMVLDVPVIAFDAGSVRDTMGGAGVLITEKDHETIAGFLSVLSKNRSLRRKLVARQRENLAVLDRDHLRRELALYLSSLGIEVQVPAERCAKAPGRLRYRIEGPFDSSYSLALLNRELARALAQLRPRQVCLHSTEGPGDFDPDPRFIARHADIDELWHRSKDAYHPEVVLRNLYPPRVHDMGGVVRLLHTYTWEESTFPRAWIEHFNSSLDAVLTASEYVRKTLINNGIRVPVGVMGVGADHILRTEVRPYRGNLGSGFRFLHISSGFPRKGVDLLLRAYMETFSAADDVTLVIKTFPNPHNRVAEQIATLRRELGAECPQIVHLDRDLDPGQILSLYQSCDALVAPSRGEGFGLPMAEAMLLELPVITTGYGGQTDFCSEETAWLIDFTYARAETHMELLDSVWVEPDHEHLKRLLRRLRELPPEQVREKTARARERVLEGFKWSDCARALEAAVMELERMPAVAGGSAVRLGWVTTWNIRCGIAVYSRRLLEHIPWSEFDITVLASQSEDLQSKDEPYVVRCWEAGREPHLDELKEAVAERHLEVVVIQFNFGFFDLTVFADLLDTLREAGVRVLVELHSTTDVNRPDFKASLAWIADRLGRADRLLVHSISDMNRLKRMGLVDNVALFPHGVVEREPMLHQETKRRLGLGDTKIIASYGFLLPHKGIPELIRAFSQVRKAVPRSRLLLVNALYPIADSELLAEQCESLIGELGLSEHVTLITDFLDDEESWLLLETADLIVYPYRHTQESASGAVRQGILTGRPVACTELEVFQDIAEVVHFLPGSSVEDIAEGIGRLLADTAELERYSSVQRKWIEAHSYRHTARRLANMITFMARIPQLPDGGAQP